MANTSGKPSRKSGPKNPSLGDNLDPDSKAILEGLKNGPRQVDTSSFDDLAAPHAANLTRPNRNHFDEMRAVSSRLRAQLETLKNQATDDSAQKIARGKGATKAQKELLYKGLDALLDAGDQHLARAEADHMGVPYAGGKVSREPYKVAQNLVDNPAANEFVDPTQANAGRNSTEKLHLAASTYGQVGKSLESYAQALGQKFANRVGKAAKGRSLFGTIADLGHSIAQHYGVVWGDKTPQERLSIGRLKPAPADHAAAAQDRYKSELERQAAVANKLQYGTMQGVRPITKNTDEGQALSEFALNHFNTKFPLRELPSKAAAEAHYVANNPAPEVPKEGAPGVAPEQRQEALDALNEWDRGRVQARAAGAGYLERNLTADEFKNVQDEDAPVQKYNDAVNTAKPYVGSVPRRYLASQNVEVPENLEYKPSPARVKAESGDEYGMDVDNPVSHLEVQKDLADKAQAAAAKRAEEQAKTDAMRKKNRDKQLAMDGPTKDYRSQSLRSNGEPWPAPEKPDYGDIPAIHDEALNHVVNVYNTAVDYTNSTKNELHPDVIPALNQAYKSIKNHETVLVSSDTPDAFTLNRHIKTAMDNTSKALQLMSQTSHNGDVGLARMLATDVTGDAARKYEDATMRQSGAYAFPTGNGNYEWRRGYTGGYFPAGGTLPGEREDLQKQAIENMAAKAKNKFALELPGSGRLVAHNLTTGTVHHIGDELPAGKYRVLVHASDTRMFSPRSEPTDKLPVVDRHGNPVKNNKGEQVTKEPETSPTLFQPLIHSASEGMHNPEVNAKDGTFILQKPGHLAGLLLNQESNNAAGSRMYDAENDHLHPYALTSDVQYGNERDNGANRSPWPVWGDLRGSAKPRYRQKENVSLMSDEQDLEAEEMISKRANRTVDEQLAEAAPFGKTDEGENAQDIDAGNLKQSEVYKGAQAQNRTDEDVMSTPETTDNVINRVEDTPSAPKKSRGSKLRGEFGM